MHPFALNDEVLDQINGGGSIVGGIVTYPPTPIAPIGEDPKTPIGPIEYSTMALGEEGGWVPQLD